MAISTKLRSLNNMLAALSIIVLTVWLPGQSSSSAQSEGDIRPLEAGKSVERDLAAGQSHYYSFVLESGQYLRMIVEAKDKNVMALLVAPGGKKLLREDTRYHATRVLSLTWVTEESGSYQLEVRSPDKDVAAGRYRVSFEDSQQPGGCEGRGRGPQARHPARRRAGASAGQFQGRRLQELPSHA